ncbi:N-acetylmuramoyl-L-alanine amidase [Methylomarinovum caldicuralii]|uniref:N-acetylmuramoyl-L-alanine amidase AmiC n=1 Tax=Methylomarinovum caldicuralii TaxID=438856 RepID=A0AAU9CD82_9GAMM|nr:N-acetylmuramoyl-L-alanine amidase [Methylomarinovum caldicuralii]BCX82564.1 N-acetylmuramoyl-L-alanine amidase [Methylomarinovum caldicuralii]
MGLRVWLGLLLGLLMQAGWALEVYGVRYWNAPDHVRLVLDVSQPFKPKVFGLENPRRLVLDLPQGRLKAALPRIDASVPYVRRIRSGHPHKGVLRLVLDLKTAVRPKVFTLPPGDRYGHRLVVDLYGAKGAAPSRPAPKPPRPPQALRDVVVAIDPGHGGEDPGAIGRHGTREKDVVLAIARKLAKLIDDTPGMRAVLIRKGDYYVPLRRRIALARQAKADLFVSIHADSFKNPRASGAGVYILSERGASSEAARWLAARENASDLVGGVSLDDKDETLAKVLLDLSLTGTREYSQRLAREVLEELKRIGRIHHSGVQQAGFVVLKSPDIPSILVETAFISNPAEERRLRSGKYQWYWARALHRGIRDYFQRHAPPGTYLAARARRHVIARGETLSEIAQQYGVSLQALMEYNALEGSRVRAGQVLRIPVGG